MNQIQKSRNLNGFSLVELMIAMLIIGIIIATAIPVYHNYITKSKLSESYNILDSMTKTQITYYVENQEFYNLVAPNPTYLDEPKNVVADNTWYTFGYPAPIGSHVGFSYRAPAGKIDPSGTELTGAGSSVSGLGFTSISDTTITMAQYNGGAVCNSGYATPASMGATAQNDYNWALVLAVADVDFDQGTSCTIVGKIIESSPATNKKPTASAYIVMNEGN